MSNPFRHGSCSSCSRLVLTGVLACATVLAPTSAVLATQLGSVNSVSLLGQPLRIEIDAPGATAEYATRCVQLTAPSIAPDGIPAVLDARLTIAGSGPDARLVISHGALVREPILRVALRDQCDSRHQREYTLLMPVATTIAPAASSTPTSSRQPSPAASSPTRVSGEATASNVWTTVPGESIATLAQALHPRDTRARRTLTERLFDLNPELARSGLTATAPLPPGTRLRVPDSASMLTAAPEPAASRRPPRSAATPAVNTRRLVLQGESDAESEAASPKNPGDIRKDSAAQDMSADAREQRLVRAVDESIRAELELLERIRRLEEIEQALRAQLAVPAPQPLKPPAAPVAPAVADAVPERTAPVVHTPPPRPKETTWGQWMFLLAALAAVVAAILFYETRRVLRTRPSRRPAIASAPGQAQDPDQEHQAEADTEAVTQTPPARPIITSPPRQYSKTGTASGPDLPPTAADPSVISRIPTPPARPDMDFDAEITAPLIVNEELVEEHDSAVELADIMISFGRVQGAAETLSDFIRANPRQSVAPWIKLMEVYRLADMRIEFDALARQLNKTFNVKSVTWDNFDEARQMPGGLEQLPHAIDRLVALWGTTECQAYLDRMLRDNRDGTRQGLSLGIIDDILMLWSVLEERLGRFHGDHLGHAA